MPEVPRETHAISRDELGRNLELALQGPHGVERPTRELAALLLAQLRKESGTKVVTNNNPGNISANPDKYKGDWYRPVWFDLEKVAKVENDAKRARYERVHQMMLDHKAPSAFRSWPSIEVGMSDHLRTLHRNFPGILKGAGAGDSQLMAHAIYNERYCTDVACQPEKNEPGLRSIAQSILDDGLFNNLPSSGGLKSGSSFDFTFPSSTTPKGGGSRMGLMLPALAAGGLFWLTLRSPAPKKRKTRKTSKRKAASKRKGS